MTLDPTPIERAQIDAVLESVTVCILSDLTIHLPPFHGVTSDSCDPSETALQQVGVEPNEYGGTIGPYRYQFEGEEDLLHLFIVRIDGAPLSPEEGQAVSGAILGHVPAGLIWFKPGHLTQHFFLGHDVLIESR